MSSDSTGEIYVVTKDDGSGVADVSRAANTNGTTPTPSTSAGAASPSSTSKASRWEIGTASYFWAAGAAVVGVMGLN